MHHRSHALLNRGKTCQPQQVHSCGEQYGRHTGAIAAVTVGILSELVISDLMPALQTPSLSHPPLQCFWTGVQAGLE